MVLKKCQEQYEETLINPEPLNIQNIPSTPSVITPQFNTNKNKPTKPTEFEKKLDCQLDAIIDEILEISDDSQEKETTKLKH
jgi:hypothetical protein